MSITGQGVTAGPMRIWAGGGLAQQSFSKRLVDDGAMEAKNDLRFCRSVTAGRLSACFFAFKSFGLVTWGRCADVERLALLHPDQS